MWCIVMVDSMPKWMNEIAWVSIEFGNLNVVEVYESGLVSDKMQ